MGTTEILFSRSSSVADTLAKMIRAASTSLDIAIYRLNNPNLGEVLHEAIMRGLRVRLVLDRGKYRQTRLTREILSSSHVPFRLLQGRKGRRSKLHHKFALFDDLLVVTGSYNWTTESEEQNFENVAILRDTSAVRAFRREFEALWQGAFELAAGK